MVGEWSRDSIGGNERNLRHGTLPSLYLLSHHLFRDDPRTSPSGPKPGGMVDTALRGYIWSIRHGISFLHGLRQQALWLHSRTDRFWMRGDGLGHGPVAV